MSIKGAIKMNIQEKIAQCEAHGIKVRRENNWLWLTGTDGRYKRVNTKSDRINLDQEAKVLFALGFKFSRARGAYYWDGTDYKALYVQAKQRAEQLKNDIETIQKQIEAKEKEINDYNEKIQQKTVELIQQNKIKEAAEFLKNSDWTIKQTTQEQIKQLQEKQKSVENTLASIEKEMRQHKSRIKAAEQI